MNQMYLEIYHEQYTRIFILQCNFIVRLVYYFLFFFSGMGEKITARLLDLGAFVYAVEKEPGTNQQLPNTKQIFCDVSDWEDSYKKMLEIGPVHGLVNNAGIAVIEPFFDVSEEGWNT